MPIIFNDLVYSVDDDINLNIYNVKSNNWTLLRRAQWRPSPMRNFSPKQGITRINY